MSLQISHQAVAGPPTKKLKPVFGEKGIGLPNRDINNQNWGLSEVKEVPGSNPRRVVGQDTLTPPNPQGDTPIPPLVSPKTQVRWANHAENQEVQEIPVNQGLERRKKRLAESSGDQRHKIIRQPIDRTVHSRNSGCSSRATIQVNGYIPSFGVAGVTPAYPEQTYRSSLTKRQKRSALKNITWRDPWLQQNQDLNTPSLDSLDQPYAVQDAVHFTPIALKARCIPSEARMYQGVDKLGVPPGPYFEHAMRNVPASSACTMKGGQPWEPSVIRKGVFNGAEVDEDTRRSIPTAFAFDPILERQRELEERDAADGYEPSVPIDIHSHIPYGKPSSSQVDQLGQAQSARNPADLNWLENDLGSTVMRKATAQQRGGRHDGDQKGSKATTPKANPQKSRTIIEPVLGGLSDEATNLPSPRPKSSVIVITKEEIARHFPERPPFRRVKTFAGWDINDAPSINRDELDLLPISPSEDRPFNRTLFEKTEIVSNAPSSRGRGGLRLKFVATASNIEFQEEAIARPLVQEDKRPGSASEPPIPQPSAGTRVIEPRRNPRRGTRDNKPVWH